MPDSDLTPRQSEILRLIQRTVQETGMPPTRKEIADELGFRSANAAEDHLRALARKGVISLLPGSSRGSMKASASFGGAVPGSAAIFANSSPGLYIFTVTV